MERKHASHVKTEPSGDREARGPTQRTAAQRLQHVLGNSRMQRLARDRPLLQARLTVSSPDDAHELEAERVADAVMRMPEPAAAVEQSSPPRVQRLCAECRDEIERRPLDEEEMVPVAEPIAVMAATDAADDTPPDEEEEGGGVMRTRRASDAGLEMSPQLDVAIRALPARGLPLAPSARAFMEPRFGVDFSAVRVHDDAHGHALARAVNAQAFTVGRDVVFGAGHYDPEGEQGRHLLAHELTHVVQQGQAPVQSATGSMSSSGSAVGSAVVQRKEFDPLAVPANNLSNRELAEAIEKTEKYLDDNKYVGDPVANDMARANLNTLVAERAARNSSAPLAEARREAWQEGEAVSKLGIVQIDEGAWFYTSMKGVPVKRLPLNEPVAVERVIQGSWYLVVTKDGNSGYMDAAAINTSMPDPEAKLYRIQPGDTAQGIVKKFYSGFRYSEDQRYYVNVLVLVNHQAKRPGIRNKTLDAPEGEGKAELDWEASQVFSGLQIWIPGQSYAKSLRGKIPTGSISYDAFTRVVDFISEAGEFLLGSVAFIAGLLHGALESLWDLLVGLVDLVKMAYSLIKSIVLGDIIGDIGNLWDTLKKIKLSDVLDAVEDWLDKKWNQPGTWDRWHFRGWLIGYIIMEIVMLVASDGLISALKWVGKSAKIAKLVEKIPFLAKAVKRAEELKAAGKLTEVIKGTKVVEGLAKARKWAQEVLAIPLEILELLTEETIGRLKKLPAWAMERFRELNAAAMRFVLGCHSPCEVKLEEIIKHLSNISKSGKGGKIITGISDMLAALPKGMDLTLITDKLTRFPGIVAGVKEAGLTAEDFKLIEEFLTAADKLNPETAYKTFTRYLTYAVPSKTGGGKEGISKLIKIFEAMGDSPSTRSLRGSIFEAYGATHLPEFAGKSLKGVEFTSTGGLTLAKARTPDFFLDATGELWDLKTSWKYDPKQLADYIKILNHTEPGLPKVTSINYLFPSKELAEANRKLTDAGALVHYLDNAGKIAKLL